MTTSLPDTAFHRAVDKIVLTAGTEHADRIKTAIVCPPTIYGPGRGPGNQRSMQLYELSRAILQRGQGFTVGAGKARWTSVNVWDLSEVYLSLVEAATANMQGKYHTASWGPEGYYFTEAGEFVWGEIAHQITTAAHKQGLLSSDTVVSLSPEEVKKMSPYGAYLWGTDSRCKAIRSRKLLGWNPTAKTIQEEVPDAVKSEAKSLGLVVGHAEKVAAGVNP